MLDPGARVVVERLWRVHDGTEVLADVSFTLEPGALVALTGRSGSGKTTLLQLLGGLDRPTSGRMLIDDVSVGELRHLARYRREVVGFVFQLHHLLPALSAAQNIEVPLIAAHVGHRERARRSAELLDEVGLADRADALPADLSGGERQRVAIARALANHPRLVLADEPTGALDSQSAQRVWELLRDVVGRQGSTVIVASHDPTLGEHVDRALQLVDGRLAEPRAPQPATQRVA